MILKRLLLGLAVGSLAAPAARAGDGPTPPPERELEDVFLTQAQALRQVFPEDDVPTIDRAEVALAPAEKERIEAKLGARLFEGAFTVHRGRAKDGSVAGYAIVTEEIGKYRPITFIVGVKPDATVAQVAVMVYRESHGSDVKRRRFLAQFDGKGLADPIQQNRDIINVSGATLSVRSVARGVRKVLRVVDELFLGPQRRTGLAWEAEKLALAAPAAAPGVVRRAGFHMGTVLEATVCAGEGREAEAARAVSAAFDEVDRLEGLLSRFMKGSDIDRMNREAGRGPVKVAAETLECVEAALDVARRSGGAFEPTGVPGGWRSVEVDREASTVAFGSRTRTRTSLCVDLGGIAKGYALDRAARVLRERGFARAMLNFGGQVLAMEPPEGAKAWVVAVEDPRGEARPALGFFEVRNASVATSSQAEQPGHIVDRRTGRAAAGALSATVVAPSGIAADALSTAAFVLGPARGAALAATEPGARSLIAGLPA